MTDKAKILLLDIELAPNNAYVWGRWKQNIPTRNFVSEFYILCFAAKWLGEPDIIFKRVYDDDDYLVVAALFELLHEADIVVAHNGDRFDIPKIIGRGLLHGYPPPSNFHQIDTLKVARKKFGFLSNSLKDLCEKLDLPRKGDHEKFKGIDLWIECLKWNEEAWQEMEEYNKQDVVSLEALYLRMRPYIGNHPNVSRSEEEHAVCPSCGSDDLQRRGYYTSKSGYRYQRYFCKNCGAWSQARNSEYNKNVLKGVV
jgi:predicted RNA-binding Zn-ribbon protein involved in translation (DUF1610 family)